jgi:hypothetical protein
MMAESEKLTGLSVMEEQGPVNAGHKSDDERRTPT